MRWHHLKALRKGLRDASEQRHVTERNRAGQEVFLNFCDCVTSLFGIIMYQWILLVCRYGVAFTYYGITLNITGFGLNLYLTQFLFAVIEVPMKIGVYFFIEKIGRRSGEMAALVLTGVCLFINLFVPTGNYFFLHLIYILQIYIQYIFFCFFYNSFSDFHNLPPREMDCSDCHCSPWKGFVRILVHNHLPLHSWALPNGCTVSLCSFKGQFWRHIQVRMSKWVSVLSFDSLSRSLPDKTALVSHRSLLGWACPYRPSSCYWRTRGTSCHQSFTALRQSDAVWWTFSFQRPSTPDCRRPSKTLRNHGKEEVCRRKAAVESAATYFSSWTTIH